MTALGENIRKRIKVLRTSQEEVARKVGISQVALHKIISGKSKTTGHLVQIAAALGCTAEELLYGKEGGEVSEPPLKFQYGKVPLISISVAGAWNEDAKDVIANNSTKFISCPSQHGPISYAIAVEGDAMTSSNGKSYPDGAIVFVDPDQVSEIVSGDQVMAKLSEFSEVVFKKYVKEGSKEYLQSLNQSYYPIYDAFQFVGKVIGKYEKE